MRAAKTREIKKTYGAEEARQVLPALIEQAGRGHGTIITRHGRPAAAIVPVTTLHENRHTLSILALAGTGAGLWHGADSVAAQRDDEWR